MAKISDLPSITVTGNADQLIIQPVAGSTRKVTVGQLVTNLTGTAAGTFAAGDDSRILGAAQQAGPAVFTDKTTTSNVALRSVMGHYYVDFANGNDAWDGLSQGTPKKNISSALGSNRVIHLAAGNVQLSAAVALDNLSNVAIIGSHRGTLIVVNGDYDAFTLTGSCTDITFADMRIVSFVARASGAGINCTSTGTPHTEITIRGVKIQNTHDGVILKNVQNSQMDDVRVLQSTAGFMAGNGIALTNSISLWIKKVQAVSLAGKIGGYGVLVDYDCDTVDLDAVRVSNTTLDGMALRNTLGAGHTGPRLVRLYKAWIEGSSANGVAVYSGRDCELGGIESAGNTLDGIRVLGGDSTRIVSPRCALNGENGINVTGTGGDDTIAQVSITDPSCCNNSDTTHNAKDGIVVAANTPVQIVGGRSGDHTYGTGYQRYGLRIAATTDNVKVWGLGLSGNTTGTLLNQSTGTKNEVQVAGINKMRPTLYAAPNGAIAETIDRTALGLANAAVTATGTLYLQAIVLPEGRTISNITWCSGNTALSGGNHQWFVLIDTSGNLLAVTGDDTSTAWAAKSLKTLAVTSPYTPGTTGLYFVGVMVDATTPPSLAGLGDIGAVLNVAAPCLCGPSSTSAGTLTTPPTIPSVFNLPTTGAAKVYAYVS